LRCPFCGYAESRVLDTSHDSRGEVRRRRECDSCHLRFSTLERALDSIPLVVKQDGSREEFSREKLLRGIKIACAKRPVSAEDMEHLAGEVESYLENLGRPEVPSRVIGDRVISRLKQLDLIAYIRYATVYLKLHDLRAIRDEIDGLLEGRE